MRSDTNNWSMVWEAGQPEDLIARREARAVAPEPKRPRVALDETDSPANGFVSAAVVAATAAPPSPRVPWEDNDARVLAVLRSAVEAEADRPPDSVSDPVASEAVWVGRMALVSRSAGRRTGIVLVAEEPLGGLGLGVRFDAASHFGRLPGPRAHFSASLLKSILQKNVRLGRPSEVRRCDVYGVKGGDGRHCGVCPCP